MAGSEESVHGRPSPLPGPVGVLTPEVLGTLTAPQTANVLWGFAALGLHNATLLPGAPPHPDPSPQSFCLCLNAREA